MKVMIDRLEMAVCAKFCSAAPLDSELDTVSRTISRCPIRFEANSDVPPPSLPASSSSIANQSRRGASLDLTISPSPIVSKMAMRSHVAIRQLSGANCSGWYVRSNTHGAATWSTNTVMRKGCSTVFGSCDRTGPMARRSHRREQCVNGKRHQASHNDNPDRAQAARSAR